MKWTLRLAFPLIISLVILLALENVFFSIEKAQLYGWWMAQNQGWQTKQTVSTRINNSSTEHYANEIASMLESADANSLSQNVALEFAEEFKDHPKVHQQLIIIAFDHPNTWVRCYWKQTIQTDYQVVITTQNMDGKKLGTKFSTKNEDCEAR